MNEIIIIGNLTSDPQLKNDRDEPYCFFTVAVNRPDGKDADFFECKAFGKTAENLCKYKKKGDEIGVRGEMRQWFKEGEEINGYKVKRWLLGAYSIHFCRGEGRNSGDSDRGQQREQPPANQGQSQGQNQGQSQNSSAGRGSYRRR